MSMYKINHKTYRFPMLCMVVLAASLLLASCSGKNNQVTDPTVAPTQAGTTEQNGGAVTGTPDNSQTAVTESPAATAIPAPTATEAPAVTETPEVTDIPEPTEAPVITAEPERDFTFDVNNPRNIEVQIVSGREYKYDEIRNAFLSEYRYQDAQLTEDYAEIFPKLNLGLMQLTEKTEDDINHVLEDLAEAALGEGNYDSYFRNEYLMPVRADSNIVSILYSYEMYSGGVHGLYGSMGFNFDPVSGKKLSIDEILADRDAFVEYVLNKIIEKDVELLVDNTEEEYKRMISSCIDDGGITLEVGYDYVGAVINPETIYPYYGGLNFICVPFIGNESMFTDIVLNSAQDYIVPIDDNYEIRGDFDDDGTADSLKIYPGYYNEYGEFEQLSIYLDSVSEPIIIDDLPAMCYGMNPTLVHYDGKDFLYISYIHTSEDFETHIYRIAGNTVFPVRSSEEAPDPAAVPFTCNGVPDYFHQAVTYDPLDMLMVVRHDIAGSCYLIGHYAADANGCPYLSEPYYMFSYGTELTLTKYIGMTIVNSTDPSRIGEDIIMQAGDTVYLYGTDGSTFIDLTVYGDSVYTCRILIMENENGSVLLQEDESLLYDCFTGFIFAD